MHNPANQIKLAVDTHHLQTEHAGTKRVTTNLLAQLRNDDSIQLTEFSPAYSLNKRKGFFSGLSAHLLKLFWVHVHLPLLCYKKGIDVLLSPEFNTPLYTHCKRAVIAHDAHMRAHRQYTSTIWFYLYYIPFIETAIRRAGLIITVSDFAKRQVAELMRIDAEKIVVAYNGIDSNFTTVTQPDAQIITKKGLYNNQYLLFVGTFEARKNIERVIEAFAQVKSRCSQHIKLAIVGGTASSRFSDRGKQIIAKIAQHQLTADVVLCGYVPDDELPAFYRYARMLVFPSLNEGFGFPIIEAFASNIPVITSNTCSMPEVAGDAALLVDPENVADIAAKIEMLLADQDLCDTLINAGSNRLKLFNWKHTARKIVSELRQIITKY